MLDEALREFQLIEDQVSGLPALHLYIARILESKEEHSAALAKTKLLVAGDEPSRHMQPYRGRGFLDALLWPAEPTFSGESPFASISFTYPDRDLGWLPGGILGILIVFFVSSMIFGALALKPLKVQI